MPRRPADPGVPWYLDPWLAGPALLSVCLALGFHVPCPFHRATGLDCPTCGGMRAAGSLLHGDVASALDHNAAAVLLGVAWLCLAGRYLLARAFPVTPRADPTLGFVVAAFLGWGIVRNLPGLDYFGSGALGH